MTVELTDKRRTNDHLGDLDGRAQVGNDVERTERPAPLTLVFVPGLLQARIRVRERERSRAVRQLDREPRCLPPEHVNEQRVIAATSLECDIALPEHQIGWGGARERAAWLPGTWAASRGPSRQNT